MRKQAGFSLIELVVAMAVLALIMGAMVNLFGSSTISLHTGAKQEVVYEEARLLMNELKTTLRYADKESIEPEKPTLGTNELTYNGSIWDRHMDISKGQNKDYKITVEWKDDTKKQLQVTYENTTDSTKKVTVFPKDIKNSVFEGRFPITAESITLNDSNTVIIYKIALPLQYELNGKMKTQTLETKVVPSEGEEELSWMEKLSKDYYDIWKLRTKKISDMTDGEKHYLEEYKNFLNNGNGGYADWKLASNDDIRKFLFDKYGVEGSAGSKTWPTVSVNGDVLYIQPHAAKDLPAALEDVVIFAGHEELKSDWNTSYIYNRDEKVWYYNPSQKENKIVLPGKTWAEVKSELLSSGWIKVK
ncbi:prepilin-type N-terminal cleavage/methylation domain-containing protein [uncultured Phascolarctobacterium sp.]|uniref:prepilin-type N-terminal cleavage/methylation domain-containing protein n=1 Tax=Phascolarctobacterium sp. TaxID=2049039 RepID=UPI0025F24A65|nr:prepilin-type N-terminal cleavage/methylation domain-containing protein [uncultured Phascolarctobacterium sp.]